MPSNNDSTASVSRTSSAHSSVKRSITITKGKGSKDSGSRSPSPRPTGLDAVNGVGSFKGSRKKKSGGNSRNSAGSRRRVRTTHSERKNGPSLAAHDSNVSSVESDGPDTDTELANDETIESNGADTTSPEGEVARPDSQNQSLLAVVSKQGDDDKDSQLEEQQREIARLKEELKTSNSLLNASRMDVQEKEKEIVSLNEEKSALVNSQSAVSHTGGVSAIQKKLADAEDEIHRIFAKNESLETKVEQLSKWQTVAHEYETENSRLQQHLDTLIREKFTQMDDKNRFSVLLKYSAVHTYVKDYRLRKRLQKLHKSILTAMKSLANEDLSTLFDSVDTSASHIPQQSEIANWIQEAHRVRV